MNKDGAYPDSNKALNEQDKAFVRDFLSVLVKPVEADQDHAPHLQAEHAGVNQVVTTIVDQAYLTPNSTQSKEGVLA
ncbi:hypothetical protein IFT48_03795 [Pseudomonas fluorescens]|uniref:hypothetical protein n=1 Tax=Pseudomonas fluorescens TaxID=294 RepID=UPI001930CC82|nr:hypothetical protein [Pseudomonas fluorescens]MBD8089093.1 hypothetical protein [Pseudomonas fluorescens]